MKLKSKFFQLANITCKTRDKGQWENPEYHVVAAIRKLRTDTNCPAGKSWPNHVKNEQHIGSEKTYGPKTYWIVNIMV